jgi:hypothetical protein
VGKQEFACETRVLKTSCDYPKVLAHIATHGCLRDTRIAERSTPACGGSDARRTPAGETNNF